MINPKYYQDIKAFPSKFEKGFELAKKLKVEGEFNKVVVCGMGGSALYVDLINDFLGNLGETFRVQANRAYTLPGYADNKTLFVLASYSGNTEETLECLKQVKTKGYKYVIFAAGGKLLDAAREDNVASLTIPTGLQPRLSTGYFIAGLLKLLSSINVIADHSEVFIKAANLIDGALDEEHAKRLAKALKDKMPVVYATSENSSIAKVTKIKFNENSKVPAYANEFPELNHNEMVGFTNLTIKPYFIIFKSKFTHPRNYVRMEVFTKLMEEKGVESEIIEMKGETLIEEILAAYYFTDHVTFYLAEEYGIDPEPVSMVEEFKKML